MRYAGSMTRPLALLLVLLAGCGAGRLRDHDQVLVQHATLAGCGGAGIVVQQVGRGTYVAEGCGNAATYVCRRGSCEMTASRD